MKLSLTERQKFKIQVERVLHVPGNFTQEILEMALVIDGRLPCTEVQETAAELAKTLKQQSEVFRNVRLNLVEWKPEERPTGHIVPMTMLMMESFTASYIPCEGELFADDLFSYLKLFQARSKLILILSAGDVHIRKEAACKSALKPFLGRKLIWLSLGEELTMEPFLLAERCGYLNFTKEK